MASKKLNPEKLAGPEKAAIFFLTMGEEFTARIFKELDETSIKKIGKHMSEITYIPSDVLNKVMNEFLNNFGSESNIIVSGENFLKQVVNKTLDKDTAREVFKVIGGEDTSIPFSDLQYISTENLYNVIQGEHPQTLALILTYLPPEKAAEVLKFFDDEMKATLTSRIVQMGQVDIDIVRELDKAIKNDISKVGVAMATRKFDGVEALASILNEVDGNTEELVLSHIEEEDSDLAVMVRQKMFVFEDLLQIEDRNFRSILQNVDNQLLAKALRTASEEMKQKVFGNLSERAAEMLKEDMEVMGPIKLNEVEQAQQEIIKATKKLEAEGRIALSKGKEDVFV
jgi:flagellar motor switch protein FliG